MPINNRKLLLLCNPGTQGVNYVPAVHTVLQRYNNYFMSEVGGAWDDGEILEEPQGYDENSEVTWLAIQLKELALADYSMIVFVGHGGAYQGNDKIQLSQGKTIDVTDFLAPQGMEGSIKRTVIVDACRSLIGATQQQLILEQREFSGQGQLDRDYCRRHYNHQIEVCEPHVELIQSTQYGNPALVNQAGTGTTFSDAFFGVLDPNVKVWNAQAMGLRTGQLSKTTNELMPLVQAGMQIYNQVPQVSRYGSNVGDYPIYAVWRAVTRVL